MARKPKDRRGVLLLVVLSILALFVLLIISYILTAAQNYRLATTPKLNESTTGPSSNDNTDLNSIAVIILVGTTNPYSSLQHVSLVEDMWGEGGTEPYSGTGVLSDADATLNIPHSIQPHIRGFLGGASFDTVDPAFLTAIASGNEGYDAPDLQNMLLAQVDASGIVIPSLHRPALVRYMKAQYLTEWNNADNLLKRRVLFRPLGGVGGDHPGFTGSNPNFDPENGPWDVDSDGDGIPDSIWVDAGLPVETINGVLVKPLVAILLVDMDGRLNVNVHDQPGGAGSNTGSGHGPAEIALTGAATDKVALIAGRYGTDGIPGSANDALTQLMRWGHPAATWDPAVMTGWRSPFDPLGKGTISLTGWGYPNYLTMSNPANDPYGFYVLGGGLVPDTPYSLEELEALLRMNDKDAGDYSQRLAAQTNKRFEVTVQSFDRTEPSSTENFKTMTDSPDLAAGMRFDLSARFGDGRDNNANNVVDEPGETEIVFYNTSEGDTLPSVPAGMTAYQDVPLDTSTTGTNRQLYAKRLYDLLKAITPATSAYWIATSKNKFLAQYCVNVVDFRDPDSIMTRFEYETGLFVWGCEAPELLISEVVPIHDRGTNDTALDPTGFTLATGDTTFDQVRRPRGSLFFELYNPRGTNDHRPGEFYYDGAAWSTDLLLNRTKVNGTTSTSPVWRMVITTDTPGTAESPNIERTVYFIAEPTSAPLAAGLVTESGRIHWSSGAVPAIPRGGYAMIGPATSATVANESITPVGNQSSTKTINLSLLSGVKIAVDPVFMNGSFNPVTGASSARKLRFSISEPVNGYAHKTLWNASDDALYATPDDVPYDYVDSNLAQNATIEPFKFIHLQRLANPLADWNATTNPYITVDSMEADLTVYTGEDISAATGLEFVAADSIKFNSRYRNGPNNNIWPQTSSAPSDGTPVGTLAAPLPNETLGILNNGFVAPTGASMFPWLTWNNRPFISNMELMMVPFKGPHDLLADHSVATGNPYAPTDVNKPSSEWYGYLPNFFYNVAGQEPFLHRLLEYVYVPTPYVGSVDYAPTGAPFHPSYSGKYSRRQPGLININTVGQTAWDAFTNGHPYPTFAQIEESRRGSATANDPLYPTAIARPFRSLAGNYSPAPVLVGGGDMGGAEILSTMLRPDPIDATKPLFANIPATEVDATNTVRNPYFRYKNYQRLGNLLTTRSNVYALWITVGYFAVDEVTADAGHPDGYTLKSEIGFDTNTPTRKRGFYIFDRSKTDFTGGFNRGTATGWEPAVLRKRHIE